MDSKLVVEQMSGRWKIKHPDMRRLALVARDLAADISAAGGSVSYSWIPREKNKDADALSNDGMDGRTIYRRLDQPPSPGLTQLFRQSPGRRHQLTQLFRQSPKPGQCLTGRTTDPRG